MYTGCLAIFVVGNGTCVNIIQDLKVHVSSSIMGTMFFLYFWKTEIVGEVHVTHKNCTTDKTESL